MDLASLRGFLAVKNSVNVIVSNNCRVLRFFNSTVVLAANGDVEVTPSGLPAVGNPNDIAFYDAGGTLSLGVAGFKFFALQTSMTCGNGNTIAFGNNNFVSGTTNQILVAGDDNIINGLNNIISNANRNLVTGDTNIMQNQDDAIVGGFLNTVSGGSGLTVGRSNIVDATGYVCIVGGNSNTVAGENHLVVGQSNSTVAGTRANILGGFSNAITAGDSNIISGSFNSIGHFNCLVVGFNLTSTNSSSAVFGTWNEIVPVNRVFQIGTGASAITRKDALFVQNDDVVGVRGGLTIKDGANQALGLATLVLGTVVVANTKVTANTRIFLTKQTTTGGNGSVSISARVVGVSFTILSSNLTDTSDVAWQLIEPY